MRRLAALLFVFHFWPRKNNIWPFEKDELKAENFLKHLAKFVLVLLLWERKTWSHLQAGRQIPFYPDCWLPFAFPSSCEGIASFLKACLPFICPSVCYGDQTWKQNLSCDSISVDEISSESCSSLLWTFNSETTLVSPCRLIRKSEDAEQISRLAEEF